MSLTPGSRLGAYDVLAVIGAGGTPTLVLELVDGPTLADRIAEGPLPFDEALPIAAQIADALVQADPFRATTPRRVFEMPTALCNLDPFVADYDVARDGRFLSVRRQGAAEVHVVLNWVEELRRTLGR